MSGANLIPPQGNGAATAPAAGGAAPAGATPGGTPFDAILMLEEMAAAAGDVGVDAGSGELGAEGTEPATDDPADDEENLELDNPLAFLAGLLAVATRPAHPPIAGDAGSGTGGGAEGVDASGGGSAGNSDASGIPFFTNDGTNPNAAGGKADDAAAAARLLAAQEALTAFDSTGKDDKSVATRATDLLAQASRPTAVGLADHAPLGSQMATHARDPRWADEFGARIALLVNQRESVAAISLTPADLGPVDVNVTVRDSQATIHFGAAQAETRALIEASLPKLRELLAAQGFQLMDASVSQGFTRQSKPDAPSVPRPSSVAEVTAVETRSIAMNGLLDTYA
jgi:flagellar hook-length control protein FliK